MFEDLHGKTVAITGGNRGIGYSLGKTLAGQGVNVALLDLADTVAESAATLAADTGVKTFGTTCNVTDETSIIAAFDAIEANLGPVDLVVNAAGIVQHVPAEEMSVEDFQRTFNINVTGTFAVCKQAAARGIAAGREVSIVNISSMSGFAVNIPQKQAAYNASKAAVAMLTQSLAVEWVGAGVRVNAIAPGYIASDMTKQFVETNRDLNDYWMERVPMGRMGTPEELGPLVTYLLSTSASRYVVGQTIVIDGGYTAI